MGHAFQQTLMDVLIRYHRMRGDNTLWQVGTDHAGIATQIVVEQQLKAEGPDRATTSAAKRSSSVSGRGRRNRARRSPTRCGAWALPPTGRASASRWTKACRLPCVETFVRLHEDGLIYRGKRLVNWDPKLMTAVSDLEVDSEEEQGKLWETVAIRCADGSGHR